MIKIKEIVKACVLAAPLLFSTVNAHAQDDVATLSECTTIDADITAKARDLLKNGMDSLGSNYGQVAVVDARTGHLKAWVALEKSHNTISDSKLQKKAFNSYSLLYTIVPTLLADSGGSLADSVDTDCGILDIGDGYEVKDHNWRRGGYGMMTMREALIKKSNVAMYKIMAKSMGNEKAAILWRKIANSDHTTNAMQMAAILSSVYCGTQVTVPTLKGDSLEVLPFANTSDLGRQYMKEVLTGMCGSDGQQSQIAPKTVEIAGVYVFNYTNANSKKDKRFSEMSFVGVVPAEAPRYAIAVFLDKKVETTIGTSILADYVVNKLVEWLAEHK